MSISSLANLSVKSLSTNFMNPSPRLPSKRLQAPLLITSLSSGDPLKKKKSKKDFRLSLHSIKEVRLEAHRYFLTKLNLVSSYLRKVKRLRIFSLSVPYFRDLKSHVKIIPAIKRVLEQLKVVECFKLVFLDQYQHEVCNLILKRLRSGKIKITKSIRLNCEFKSQNFKLHNILKLFSQESRAFGGNLEEISISLALKKPLIQIEKLIPRSFPNLKTFHFDLYHTYVCLSKFQVNWLDNILKNSKHIQDLSIKHHGTYSNKNAFFEKISKLRELCSLQLDTKIFTKSTTFQKVLDNSKNLQVILIHGAREDTIELLLSHYHSNNNLQKIILRDSAAKQEEILLILAKFLTVYKGERKLFQLKIETDNTIEIFFAYEKKLKENLDQETIRIPKIMVLHIVFVQIFMKNCADFKKINHRLSLGFSNEIYKLDKFKDCISNIENMGIDLEFLVMKKNIEEIENISKLNGYLVDQIEMNIEIFEEQDYILNNYGIVIGNFANLKRLKLNIICLKISFDKFAKILEKNEDLRLENLDLRIKFLKNTDTNSLFGINTLLKSKLLSSLKNLNLLMNCLLVTKQEFYEFINSLNQLYDLKNLHLHFDESITNLFSSEHIESLRKKQRNIEIVTLVLTG